MTAGYRLAVGEFGGASEDVDGRPPPMSANVVRSSRGYAHASATTTAGTPPPASSTSQPKPARGGGKEGGAYGIKSGEDELGRVPAFPVRESIRRARHISRTVRGRRVSLCDRRCWWCGRRRGWSAGACPRAGLWPDPGPTKTREMRGGCRGLYRRIKAGEDELGVRARLTGSNWCDGE